MEATFPIVGQAGLVDLAGASFLVGQAGHVDLAGASYLVGHRLTPECDQLTELANIFETASGPVRDAIVATARALAGLRGRAIGQA